LLFARSEIKPAPKQQIPGVNDESPQGGTTQRFRAGL